MAVPARAFERVMARDQWVVGGCLLAIAALAWLWLWRQWVAMGVGADAAVSMPDMDMGGAMMVSASDAGPYLASAFVMWLLMMVAMMLPSAAPMILIYDRMAASVRAQGGALAPTALFAGVYLAVWGVLSLGAALAQWLLIRTGAISDLTLAFGDRRIGGALLIAAGLYQATPLKRACLDSCRSPASFLLRFWRPGWAGAARLGLVHGLYCFGCCAVLMALLFVFGVMNLVWVAALALIVAAEKLLPFGERLATAIGLLAIAAGAGTIAGFVSV